MNSKPPIYKRRWFIIIAVLLMLGVIGSCSGGGNSKSSYSDSSQSASSQSGTELKATTEYLEYSHEEVDPITLVKASDRRAQVSAKDKIDLKTVGVQSVTYKITSDDQIVEQIVEFMVRDTKAPTVKLSNDNPSIEQGGSYNLQDAILSIADEIDGELALVEAAPEAKGKNAGAEVFYDQGWYTLEGSIDFSTPGTYPIKITAADKHGNVMTKELNVTVKDPVQKEAAPTAAMHAYIANASSRKFHVPSCSAVRQMNESNKVEITATRDEMIDSGYDPCGRCNP